MSLLWPTVAEVNQYRDGYLPSGNERRKTKRNAFLEYTPAPSPVSAPSPHLHPLKSLAGKGGPPVTDERKQHRGWVKGRWG